MTGGSSVRSYWDVERFDDFAGSEAQAIEEIEHQLSLRVRERLESEVPLGAFLSGGIDSGLVVSHMAQAHGQPVITTTIGFGEAAHNELAPAEITARHFATAHYAHEVEPDLDTALERVSRSFDEPFADSSAVTTDYLCAGRAPAHHGGPERRWRRRGVRGLRLPLCPPLA